MTVFMLLGVAPQLAGERARAQAHTQLWYDNSSSRHLSKAVVVVVVVAKFPLKWWNVCRFLHRNKTAVERV